MIVVIIAGGSGTRLWPLSTPDYPKHLLSINGDKQSLLQQTYKRAKKLTNVVYVVTEEGHINHVINQLPDLPKSNFIVEPARRGTANCILAVLTEISKRHDHKEPVAFMHADHYIRDTAGFVYSFQLAAKTTDREQRIVLIGVEPDYPATGFGYIKKGELLNKSDPVFNVGDFKEKPNYEAAKTYINSGDYLWNGGYFVGSLDTFLKAMTKSAPSLKEDYEKLLTADKNFKFTYLGFKNEAIDYALIEKVSDLLVVSAAFDWMDLGSFRDLARAVGSDEAGNYIHGDSIETEEVENSFIYTSISKPIAVIGLDNIVVVDTPNGLLVARKDLSQKIGEISKRFK